MIRLEDFKTAIWELRKEGRDVDVLFVHPASMPIILNYLYEWGIDIFPGSKFSIFHPFRKRDKRPHMLGIPIEEEDTVPFGTVGVSNNGERMSEILKAIESNSEGGRSDEDPLMSDLHNPNGHNLTDMMIKSMEGLDAVRHAVVLRFHHSGRFEILSSMNELELRSALQMATMRVMQGD